MASLNKITPLRLTDVVMGLDGKILAVTNLLDLIYEVTWEQVERTDAKDIFTSGGIPLYGVERLRFIRDNCKGRMPWRPTLQIVMTEPLLRGEVEHSFWMYEGPRAKGVLLRKPDFRIPLYGEPYPFDLPYRAPYEWNYFFRHFSKKYSGGRNPQTMFTHPPGISKIFSAIMVLIAWTEAGGSGPLPSLSDAGVAIATLTEATALSGGYGD